MSPDSMEKRLRASALASGITDETIINKLVESFMQKTETDLKQLTPVQARVYDHLNSGKPVYSQAQLARDLGFDHPTKLTSILSALVVKGYMVPRSVLQKKD